MKSELDVLFLSEEEMEKCIDYKEAIKQVEEAWKRIGNNQASEDRSKFLKTEEAFMVWMGGWARGTPGFNLLVGLNFENPQKYGLRSGYGLAVLFDPKTGVPLAVMSAVTYLRIVKTASASAVAAKYLAKKGSSRIAIIGGGEVGKGHFLAMKEIFNLEEVRIFDISTGAREGFVSEMSKYGIKILPVNSIQEAVKGADIVITATTADAPLIKKDWLEEGMLLLKIGTNQEMEPDVILVADKVITDWWDYTIKIRSKEIKMLLEQGLISEDELRGKKFHTELPEIAVGSKRGRENDTEKIVSIQLGLCADYATIAAYIYERALEVGLGQKVKLM